MSTLSRATGVLAVLLVGLVGGACGQEPQSAPPPASSPTVSHGTGATPSAATAPATTRPTGAPTGTPGPPGASPSPAPPSASSTTSHPRLELPRGGRAVFPRYRLVGYAGLTGARTLGRLGTGPLDQRVTEMELRARPYGASRQILPVLEVITTVVQGSPGPHQLYRTRISDAQIATYLKAARAHRALLLLNIQPGRARFIDEVHAYGKWLKQPDVGVALDPEWAMGSHQVPGRVFGHTTGAVLDDVASYLAGLVQTYDLPEKVMVYHQLAAQIVHQESRLHRHAGVAIVKSVDGLGHPAAKKNTYRVVNETTPSFVHAGFKLFYTEDLRNHGRLMTPGEVLGLKPRPEYILYE